MDTLVFVYGTLRSGLPDHHRLCHGARSSPAFIPGKIFQLPQGYPALQLPASSILYSATADKVNDEAVRRALASAPPPQSPTSALTQIQGDLLAFADASTALPPLDEWEDFAPGRGGLYTRVLTHAYPVAASPVVSWVYIMQPPPPAATEIPSGIWTPPATSL